MENKPLFIKMPGQINKGAVKEELAYPEQKINPFGEVTAKLDDVKKAMQTNIELVLKRGEDLEDLESKTEDMTTKAIQFSNQGKRLKNTMRWRKIKMILLLICIILIIVGVIVGIVYGTIVKSN
jgi:t-SNARE complex subunit (syntaxin)